MQLVKRFIYILLYYEFWVDLYSSKIVIIYKPVLIILSLFLLFESQTKWTSLDCFTLMLWFIDVL